MEEKTIRISKQVNKFLDNCSESELEVCSAYYLPNIREIEEYLKQGDYNTQLAKLLSGNNPLQNHIASNQIQKEFNELVNQGMVYELGTEDKYNSDIICNMILSLLSKFQQDNNQRDFSSRITQIVNRDIKKRIDTSVQKNKNVLEGIKDMLTTKLSKSLGLSQTEYDSISNEIETLANEIYKELLSSQYISSRIVLPKEEDLKKLKNKMYNDPNYLSNILPLPKDKIISRETLAQRVIYEVMYKSASNALTIEVNKQLGYIRINGEILPITLYDDILSFLKENSHKAFTNINMYLTSNDTVFIDEFQRQYILHLDNTHILGIEKNSKFLEFIINERTKFEEIQTKLYQGIRFEDLSTEEKSFYTSWQKKYLSPIQPVSKPNFIGCKNIVFGPKIENISPTLRIMNRLYKLSDNPPHNRPEINEQIEHVNNIQQQINGIMSSQKEDKIFERLVYFLIKDSNNPLDVIKNITKEKIKEVIDSNVCVFSNKYNINFQNNPDSVLSKVSELNKSELNRIKNKYDEIFSIQEYLNYKYKVISQSVIRYLPSFEWEKYLGGKHDTINGRLDNSKIGLFGIAQLLIENEIDEHASSLKDGINIENPIFNLFKVADKTYYIVNFNYVTDIKKIFIVDKENGGKTYDIICEMEAFEETLMAYFEEIETNGTARFYSVQNTEDVLMKTFKDSRFGQVIDSKGNEYTTILVFAQTSDDQRITQHYTSTKGKILSVNDFIQKILSNKIELRTATSLEVSGNYEKDTKKKISDLFRHIITTEKTLSKESMNELSFIGASNADQIIEEMTLEETKKFIGIDNITEEEFSLIKLILKQKNLESLLKVIPAEIETMRMKVNESTNGVNTAMQLNSAEAGIYLKQLQDKAQHNHNKLNELLSLQGRIESIMRYNREILSRKDSTGQPIELSSSEGIRNYIDNNIKDLNSDHIVILHYLASCAKSIGDLKLHNYIKDICFNLYVLEEKTKFEKKYNSCVTKYEQRKSSIMATEQDALTIFDNELLPYKNKILYDIANFIDNNYLPTTEDKIRYLGLADKELSSIVRIENSRSSKTQFETEVSIDRQKQTDLFALYASDKLTILENSIYTNLYTSDISSSGKINNIVKLCEEFVKEIDSNKSRYTYDATELIDKYFFDDERTAQIENDRLIQFNDINALIASECSILNIVDILLKYLKEDLKDIYDKYVKSGVSLFESEVRDIEKMTNSRKRQSEYIEKIHNRVQIYTMTISKLYATLIKHSGKYDVGKATIISELIQEKLQETRIEIEKKTNSPVFSYGTAELTRNILSDNASPILYDLSPLDHQLRSLSESENPVTGLKM